MNTKFKRARIQNFFINLSLIVALISTISFISSFVWNLYKAQNVNFMIGTQFDLQKLISFFQLTIVLGFGAAGSIAIYLDIDSEDSKKDD